MRIIRLASLNISRENWNYGPVYIVRGDTYPVRQTLSNLGFKWSGPQKGWYMSEPKYLQILPTIKQNLINIGVSFPQDSSVGNSTEHATPTFSPPTVIPKKEILEGEEYPPKGEDYSSVKASEIKTRDRYKFPIRKNILQFPITFTLSDDPEPHTENVVVNRYFKKGVTSDNWKITFNAEYASYPLYEFEIGRSAIAEKPIFTLSKTFLEEGKAWGTYDERDFLENEGKKYLEGRIPTKFPNVFKVEYDCRKRDPEFSNFLKTIEGHSWDIKNRLYTIRLNSYPYEGEFPVTVSYGPPMTVTAIPDVDHPQAPKYSFKNNFEVSLYKIHDRKDFEKKMSEILNSEEAKKKYVEYLESFPYVSGEQKPGYQNFLRIVDTIAEPEPHAGEVLGKIRSLGYVRESMRVKGATVVDTKKIWDDLSVENPGLDYFYAVVAYQVNYFHKRYHEKAFVQSNLFSFISSFLNVLNKYDDVVTSKDLWNSVDKLGNICYQEIFGEKRSKGTWENFNEFYSGFGKDEGTSNGGQKPPVSQETSNTALQMLKELAEIHEIPVSDIRTEAKRIYHQLAMKLHPDRNIENVAEATEQFKVLGKIWDMIPEDIKKANNWYGRFVLSMSLRL